MIYIDPPYNTGNKDFVYHDAFKEEPEFIVKNIPLDTLRGLVLRQKDQSTKDIRLKRD